jgi:hypothetical protein
MSGWPFTDSPDHGDTRDTPVPELSPPGQASEQQQWGDGDRQGQQGHLQAARPRTSWTAAELLAEEFPEPRWAVPGIVPEGCILLAGPPKVGKSWLTLGLGLSVASGGKALGRLAVPAGPVLYLALEDTPRRLKARLLKMLAGDPAPATMTLVTPARRSRRAAMSGLRCGSTSTATRAWSWWTCSPGCAARGPRAPARTRPTTPRSRR